MGNLIKSELFKLQRNKTFWVLLFTTTGVSALLHYLIIIDWWQVFGTSFDSVGLSELNALSTFTLPLLFNLIVSTLAGFFVSVEFSHSGVIKNQVISGNKRSHIFMSKFLVFSLGSIILTILTPLVTVILEIILLCHEIILSLSNIKYLGTSFDLYIL